MLLRGNLGEVLALDQSYPLVKIGERTNAVGSTRFARLMKAGNLKEAVEMAAMQVQQGAQILDISTDGLEPDSMHLMLLLIDRLELDEVTGKVPLAVDSASWDVLDAGLRRMKGVGLVNSLNLKNGEKELERKVDIVCRHGVFPVVQALDERGPALTAEKKLEICKRALSVISNLALRPDQVVLDPVLLPIGTGMPEHDAFATEFLAACSELRRTVPNCLICCGLSNLSFVYRGRIGVRRVMHAVFLRAAIKAGLNLAIMDPTDPISLEKHPPVLIEAVEDVVFNRKPKAAIALSRLLRQL